MSFYSLDDIKPIELQGKEGESRIKMDFILATDGVSFNVIRDHFPKIYERLCTRGKVFARMTPDQKEFLIEELQELGYYVGKSNFSPKIHHKMALT